jgi:hypothetical protein
MNAVGLVYSTVVVWTGFIRGDRGGTLRLYIFGTLFTCYIVWYVFRELARTKQIREFSARKNLTYVGSALPATAFQCGNWIRRAFLGRNGGKDLVVFDCSIGYGKGRLSRTVVAARGQSGGFGWARFGPDLVAQEVDDWSIVYSSNRFMSIAEIEILVSVFNAPAGATN